MAEATNIVFTPLDVTGTHKRALITATASTSETITLTDHEHKVEEIKAVSAAHQAATGDVLKFSYTNDVLTLETSTVSDDDVVIEIIYA